MRNQKGEIVIGVMVAMMAVMMIFSGMAWTHGGHRADHGSTRHCNQLEQRQDHDPGVEHITRSREQPAIPPADKS